MMKMSKQEHESREFVVGENKYHALLKLLLSDV